MFNKTVIGICIALLVGTFLGYVLEKQQPSEQTITVVGNAAREVLADKAKIMGAVTTIGASAEVAAAENKKKLDTLKATLLSAGLAENAFTTEATITSPDTQNGFASQTVFTISLEDKGVDNVDKYLNVLDFYDTEPDATYSLKDRSSALNEVKQQAVADAKAQADNLAKVNNLRVGKVISVEERETEFDPNFALDDTLVSDSREVPLSSSYTVTYQLTPVFLPF